MPKISEANQTPKAKKSKKKAPAVERPIKHPAPAAVEAWGDKAITVEKMKEILGWREGTAEFYHLKDRDDKYIILDNSTRNRPFSMSLAEMYVQEHLNKRWRLNGENLIIGKYGEVISGQHRGAALILAEQDRVKEPRWQENWPDTITMSTFVAVGVEETDDVVNTVDTGKPRSLSDTIYRSEHFADLPPKPRKRASSMADWCIRMLWQRTGAQADAFSPRRTHGASLEFLDNHRKIRQAVRHVLEEDADGGISAVLSPGYSSAMLYLMAAGKTDPVKYRAKAEEGQRSEKYLDFSLLDKAMEFWLLLGQEGSDISKSVSHKIKQLNRRQNADGEMIPATLDEKMIVVTYAWLAFLDGKEPKFPREEDLLKNPPLLGGIDLGEDGDDGEVDSDDDEADEEDPVEAKRKELEATRPDRVKQRYEEIKAEKEQVKEVKAAHKDDFAKLQEENPGQFILYRSKSGGYVAGGEQGEEAIKILGLKSFSRNNGSVRAIFPDKDFSMNLTKLQAAGKAVTVIEEKIVGQDREKKLVVTRHDTQE